MEPQEYAVYRSYLEAGRALFAFYETSGEARPEAKALLDQLLAVDSLKPAILAIMLEVAVESDDLGEDEDEATPEQQAMLATRVFGRYPQLLAALDGAGGDGRAQVLAQAPEAATGDLEWWAVALSAGFALHLIGKLSWQGALVAQIAARLFAGMAAYGLITAKTKDGENVIAAAAKGAGSWLWSALLWTLGAVAVVSLVGFAVHAATRAREERRALG